MSWSRKDVHLRGVSARVPGRTHPMVVPSRPPVPRGTAPVRLPGVTGASPAVIEDRFRHLVMIAAIDDSGSTYGFHGTDPRGVRYAAAHSVIDWMRRHGGGHAGVIHWGTDAPARFALAPVPVNRKARQLRRALGRRPQLGGTIPATALHRAADLLPPLGPGDVPAILLITDGLERGPGMGEALAAVPPGSVHLVTVGDCPDQEDDWHELPLASATRLTSFADKAAVAWECGAIVARALGLQLRPLPLRSTP